MDINSKTVGSGIILVLAQLTLKILIIMSFWYNYSFYKSLSDRKNPSGEDLKHLTNIYYSLFIVSLIAISVILIFVGMNLMRK